VKGIKNVVVALGRQVEESHDSKSFSNFAGGPVRLPGVPQV